MWHRLGRWAQAAAAAALASPPSSTASCMDWNYHRYTMPPPARLTPVWERGITPRANQRVANVWQLGRHIAMMPPPPIERVRPRQVQTRRKPARFMEKRARRALARNGRSPGLKSKERSRKKRKKRSTSGRPSLSWRGRTTAAWQDRSQRRARMRADAGPSPRRSTPRPRRLWPGTRGQ